MDSDAEIDRVAGILSSSGLVEATTKFRILVAIKRTIQSLQTATRDFDNRGLFENHYLTKRIFDDAHIDVGEAVKHVHEAIDGTKWDILRKLGWELTPEYGTHKIDDTVSVTITPQDDLNVRKSDSEVAPSYIAVDALKDTTWSILTNGKEWRLYSTRVSASTTNYFALTLDPTKKSVTRYLVTVFGSNTYRNIGGYVSVEVFFKNSRDYARGLEVDLSSRIMGADGIFLDIVKGILDHDMKKEFSVEELEDGRRTALTVMYRIWFILYAESRDLLPIKDEKYQPISLQTVRASLEEYESRPDDTDCWEALLRLFGGIRSGSREHNLPQYDGDLFKNMPQIDNNLVKNRYGVQALRGLLERDGKSVDYASMDVRHLGSVYETLMEYSVRQAKKDIMLVEENGKIREVKSRLSATYSYKKNDLYLASKGGIALRKSTASYYTPDEMVKFLVRRGLEPIFLERGEVIAEDLRAYAEDPSEANRRTCMNRMLDIQVLDPAMGSGHFLVEALSRITEWVTRILKAYPKHPLLAEIDADRNQVVEEQQKRGIAVDPSRLADDVLLKRRVMKRCIFGVDLNPLAVDLCKLSLWLDSFAIGVPLTYLNHHIKHGDSTIGMWCDDLASEQDTSLDTWMEKAERVGEIMENISQSADVTVDGVRCSEDSYSKYESRMAPHKIALDALTAFKIDKNLLSVGKNKPKMFARRLGQIIEGDAKHDEVTRRIQDRVNELQEKYAFFHWELEMMDAFTDKRRGFDLIVGNPPWDKIKHYDDEFFVRYSPTFPSLKTKLEKMKQIDKIRKLHSNINQDYMNYKQSFKDKNTFYNTYELQGIGDRDAWQVVLERMLRLISKNGFMSILIPSQILTSVGTFHLRKSLLSLDVRQIYVFENKMKIFPIHREFRFALLTVRNTGGCDAFQAGFWLHDLNSLEQRKIEGGKFTQVSKKRVLAISPETLVIPEVGETSAIILEKISNFDTLASGLSGGWEIAISQGFHRTNDSDLLKKSKTGWPVLEGKNTVQFNHTFRQNLFQASPNAGLERLSTKRAYKKQHKLFFDSFQLVFHDLSTPTVTRTTIASIIPPHTFHTNKLPAIVLTHNGKVEMGLEYIRRVAYLAGLFNSTTFDFIIRSKIRLAVAPIIKYTPIPNTYNAEIATLAAKLSVGTDEFSAFAEFMRVPNTFLTPPEKIHTCARLDALVAVEYGLSRKEYLHVLGSFKFSEDPLLLEAGAADWSDKRVLREFYGEVRKLAPAYYDDISKRRSE